MNLKPSWRRVTTSLLLTLLAAGTASAQVPSGPTQPSYILQQVDSGKGWSRLMATDPNVLTKGGMQTPVADLLVISAEGIDDLKISQMHKDELYEDFGISNNKAGELPTGIPSDELIIIDYAALAQMETGIWRPEYLALAEPEPLTGEGAQPDAILGCSGWKNRDKTKTWNIDNSPLSQNFNLGGGFTGNFNVQLPFVTTGTAKLNYQIKKNFLCIPYKFRVKNVQATGQAALGGSAQLQANASLAYKWENDWQIANPHLGRITFWVGFIPVWIDFKLPITAGLKLDAKVTATVAQNFNLGSAGSFSYECTTSTCTGGNTFQNAFTTSGVTASIQGEIEAEANAKVQVRAEVWSGSLLNAQAGVKGFVKAKVWGYYGNNCGDGNGDGQNETVRALVAEADAGFDIVYSIGGYLAPDKSGDITGGRYDLGWWDLLGSGGSTVLSPMLAGPTTAQAGENVSYVVRMRPCYPYTKAVDLQMGPGTWSGTLKIDKPKGLIPSEYSTTLTRNFPTGGNQTIVATAVRDSEGRNLNASTSRVLQVQQIQISPRGGHWYNPARSGTGIEFLQNMYNEFVAIWYTYEGGEPVWYISDVATVQNNSWSAPLYRSVWNYGTNSNSISVVGSLGLDFTSDSQATMNWSLYGQSGSEPYDLLFAGTGRSGSWYPPNQSGWGLSIAEDQNIAIVAVQYYDGGGQPTWAMGSATPGSNLNATMLRYHGTNLCPGCTGTPSTSTESAGTVTISNAPVGSYINVTTNIPGWHHTNIPFYMLAYH